MIANGENVIADGLATITDANSTTNPIFFPLILKNCMIQKMDGNCLKWVTRLKDLMKTNINLSSGDIVEFFEATDTFLEKHNSEDLFS